MIRKLVLAVAAAVALLAAASPASAAIECNRTALYDSNATGATKIITGDSKASVYICGYTIVSGGTTNVSLKSGTGTNCATGTAAVTPAFSTVAQGRVSDDSSAWRGLSVAPGLDVCINSSGTTIAVQAIVYFTQR